MTDNIFEVETTALAHAACVPQESSILLTDFAAAYPSVNHSWIVHVLEKAELPEFIRRFLRMICCNGAAQVEIAGENQGTIPHGQGREAKLSCERLLICSGVRSHLPLAREHDHPKEPWRS